MSLHTLREWSPEEAVAATSRPLPAWIKTAVGALFGIGLVIFIVGILVAPDRAWRAFHFNWLFFFGLIMPGVDNWAHGGGFVGGGTGGGSRRRCRGSRGLRGLSIDWAAQRNRVPGLHPALARRCQSPARESGSRSANRCRDPRGHRPRAGPQESFALNGHSSLRTLRLSGEELTPGLGLPFQGEGSRGVWFRGRCPRLRWQRPLASNLQGAESQILNAISLGPNLSAQ